MSEQSANALREEIAMALCAKDGDQCSSKCAYGKCGDAAIALKVYGSDADIVLALPAIAAALAPAEPARRKCCTPDGEVVSFLCPDCPHRAAALPPAEPARPVQEAHPSRWGVEIEFEVWQDDMPVATASSADEHAAFREAVHYAAQYGQDGPVEIKRVVRTTVTLPSVSDERPKGQDPVDGLGAKPASATAKPGRPSHSPAGTEG